MEKVGKNKIFQWKFVEALENLFLIPPLTLLSLYRNDDDENIF